MNPSLDFVDTFLRASVPEIEYEYRHANTARTGNLCGEQMLMMAVLEDALDAVNGKLIAGCYSRTAESRLAPQREALCWFASEDDSWPFSFRSICDYLGYDPQAVRAKIR